MPTPRLNLNQASHTETTTVEEDQDQDPITQALALGITPETPLQTRQGKSRLEIQPPPPPRRPNVPSGIRPSNARFAMRLWRQASISSITAWNSPNWKLEHLLTCMVLFLKMEKKYICV
jgi:hypothetical protein